MRIWHDALTGIMASAATAMLILLAAAHTNLIPVNGTQLRGYLLAHPELVGEMTTRFQQMQQEQQKLAQRDALRKVGMAALFDPRIAFVVGPANAKKTVVEFYDYNCPYCRASMPSMMRLMALHARDTRIAFIEFPIKGGNSAGAARFAMAARQQPAKFLALHFALMGEETLVDQSTLSADAQKVGLDMNKLKSDLNAPQTAKSLADSHTLATKLGINGTPTFIVNGVIHPGAVDDETLDALLNNNSAAAAKAAAAG